MTATNTIVVYAVLAKKTDWISWLVWVEWTSLLP